MRITHPIFAVVRFYENTNFIPIKKPPTFSITPIPEQRPGGSDAMSIRPESH